MSAHAVSGDSESAATRRAAFLAALHDSCEGLRELRALPSKARAFAALSDVAGVERFIARAAAADDLYVAIATRIDASSGALENCRHLPALFVDVDFKTTPEPQARALCSRFPVPPSASIHSGGGLHDYWFLREPIDLRDPAACAEARQLLRRLAVALGADLTAAEPARVLRLPGTFNSRAIRQALGTEPDEHVIGMLRFDVLVALRRIESEIATGMIGSAPVWVRGRPLGDWLDLGDAARLLREWPAE